MGEKELLLMIFLIWAPPVAAAVIFFTGQRRISRIVAMFFSIATVLSTLLFTGASLTVKGMDYSLGWLGGGFVAAIGIAAVVVAVILSVWRRRPVCLLLAVAQLILFLQNAQEGMLSKGDAVFFADRLSLIGILLAGVVGSILCAGLTSHLVKTGKGRLSPVWGYGLLSAVMALVLCDDVTLLSGLMALAGLLSCLLAESGEPSKQRAEGNAQLERCPEESQPQKAARSRMGFSVLSAALFAGILVQLALPSLSNVYGVFSVSRLAAVGASGVSIILPLTLLTLAGLALAAQMPFSQWMLQENGLHERGQALLKGVGLPAAGAYLLLRLSPALGGTLAGTLAAAAGGMTLLCMGITAWRTRSGQAMAPGIMGAVVLLASISAITTFWSGMLLLLYGGIGIALQQEGRRRPELSAAGEAGLLLSLAGLTVGKSDGLITLAHQGYLLPLFVFLLALFLFAAACAPHWGKGAFSVESDTNREQKQRKGIVRFLCCPLLLVETVCFAALPIFSHFMVPYTASQFPDVATDFGKLTHGDIATALILVIGMLSLWISKPGRSLQECEIENPGRMPEYETDQLMTLAFYANQIGTVLMALFMGVVLAVLWGGAL